MLFRIAHLTLLASAISSASVIPIAAPVAAQNWRGGDDCRGIDGRDRARCERVSDRRDNRWDRNRERERRKDAKTDGIVAGVVGTAILGGIIAAVASGNKKRDEPRRDPCEASDSYRASDGRWYPCR